MKLSFTSNLPSLAAIALSPKRKLPSTTDDPRFRLLRRQAVQIRNEIIHLLAREHDAGHRRVRVHEPAADPRRALLNVLRDVRKRRRAVGGSRARVHRVTTRAGSREKLTAGI